MRIHLTKATVVAAIHLLGLGATVSQVNAATLFIGRYGSFVRDINQVGFIPQSKVVKQLIKYPQNHRIYLSQKQIKKEQILGDINALGSSEILKEQVERESNSTSSKKNSDRDRNSSIVNLRSSNLETLIQKNEPTQIDSKLTEIANPNKINQDITNRYHGLVENDEQISLFEANQLSKELMSVAGASGKETQSQSNLNTKSIIENTLDTEKTSNKSSSNNSSIAQNTITSQDTESKTVLLKSFTPGILIVVIGSSCIALFFVVNVIRNRKKSLPDEIITLHKKTLNKVTSLARKIEKIDDEKFQDREFIIYIKQRNKIEQGFRKREPICLSIRYLEVGLIAQSSFLQLEQTELKYRSRKQQDFYNFVANSITDDVDKNVFRSQVKRKLAEIMPLVHTEEGRTALQSYLKEVEKNIAARSRFKIVIFI